ncbi:MAG: nuclear transport factor 2 family protein [bacterium]
MAKEDAKRAYALDREFVQEQLDDDEVELDEVPPAGICPYCRAEVDAAHTECPRCGLVIAFNNLEIVQSLYKAFADHDSDQIRAILDPEIEWIQNEGFPGGGRHLGAEAVISDVLGRLGRDWEGWGAEVGRWLDAGESIVALGEYQGTNRATGKSMTAAFAHVLWLREGRVVRFEQYADTAKVAAACPALGK